MRHIDQHQKGIGLIEVMVTLVIISIGILGLVNFQSFAFQSAAVASQRAKAITLAQDKMAKLRTFSSIGKQGGTPTCPEKTKFVNIDGECNEPDTSTGGYPDYTLDIAVKDYCYVATNSAPVTCNATNIPDLKRVTITVRWDKDREFVLSSFIASIDPAAAGQLYN